MNKYNYIFLTTVLITFLGISYYKKKKYYPKIYKGNKIKLPKLLQEPLPFGWNAWIQVCFFALKKELIKYETNIDEIILTKNQKGSLLWCNKNDKGKIIVLMIHGVIGDTEGMSSIINYLLKEHEDWIVVGYDRPGHKHNAKIFNTVGFTEDLDIVINTIKELYPEHKIVGISWSAGTGLLISYLIQYSKIDLGILISPGYNFKSSLEHIHPVADKLMTDTMKKFIKRNNVSLEDLYKCNSMKEWHDNMYKITGLSSTEEYFNKFNPENRYNEIKTPTLFINSYDDMFFPKELIEKYKDIPDKNPNILIVHTEYGGHCTFYDILGNNNWLNKLINQFIIEHILI
jgi:predicted alpha/beta-fold hydrolase